MVDTDNTIQHVEYVKEVADFPNYERRWQRPARRSGACRFACVRDDSPALSLASARALIIGIREPQQVLLRGGLTIGAGIITGNVIGFRAGGAHGLPAGHS